MAGDPVEIWLSPMCEDASDEGRLWSSDDRGPCEDEGCRLPCIKYVRADEITTLRTRLHAIEAENVKLREIADAAGEMFRVWAAGDEPRPTQYPEWNVLSRAVAYYDASVRPLSTIKGE